ncbi:MAG: hypothetical protein ACI9FD_004773 [Gammaproteobacteria bacterium]|jgi:hypothetical protein
MYLQAVETYPANPAWHTRGSSEFVFSETANNDLLRKKAVAFIRESYQANYGAELNSFLPWIVACQRLDDNIEMAFGLNPANDGDLFLEVYLDQPVENLLSRATGTSIKRNSIVEIGNLAFSNNTNLVSNLKDIARYCLGNGFEYVICTASRLLRLIFSRAYLQPIFLGDAHYQNLRDNPSHWGDYYRFTPKVLAGNLRQSLSHLTALR